jgi:hypothetical protein
MVGATALFWDKPVDPWLVGADGVIGIGFSLACVAESTTTVLYFLLRPVLLFFPSILRGIPVRK